MVLQKIKDKYYMLGLTKYVRIQNYLNYLGEKIKISHKKDIETVERIEQLVDERLKALNSLYIIIFICYLGIYFSFVSYVFSDVFILTDIAQALSKLFGFFGTTIFVIGLFFSSRLSNLHYQDLNLLSAHLIAIYNKYETENDEILFEGLNQYKPFLDFFKMSEFK